MLRENVVGRLVSRSLHILDGNLAQIGNMPQIEAYGLAHEQIERHLVHGLAVGTDMPESIDMRADDLEYMIAYQIGALQALAAYSDVKVTHLKPHGALNNMAAENSDYAMAIGRAIKTVDRSIIYVALAGSEMEKAGRTLGLRVAREGFCDRQYEDDGNLTSRKIQGSVIKDPVVATKQVVEMVLNNRIRSRNGKTISCTVDTLCLHGDEPTAIAVAKSVREGLVKAGVKLVPLTEMALD